MSARLSDEERIAFLEDASYDGKSSDDATESWRDSNESSLGSSKAPDSASKISFVILKQLEVR